MHDALTVKIVQSGHELTANVLDNGFRKSLVLAEHCKKLAVRILHDKNDISSCLKVIKKRDDAGMIELRKNGGFGRGDSTLVHELHCNELSRKLSPCFVNTAKRTFSNPLKNLILVHYGRLRPGKAAGNVCTLNARSKIYSRLKLNK